MMISGTIFGGGPKKFGVWGSGPTNVFYASNNGIYHFDGSSWTLGASTPALGAQTAIWGSGPTDVFAVGAAILGIAHYDGMSWTIMVTGVAADAVWGSGPTDVFAVGASGSIQHYDGTNWTAMTSGTTQTLTGVWGTGPSSVFAVGTGGTVLHYDGTRWSTVASPGQDLSGIWGSGTADVFAVGAAGTLLHYGGASYDAMASGTALNLRGVWGDGASDVFSVGDAGTILRFNGVSWSAMSNPSSISLTGVWGTGPNNVYAVDGGLLHYDGTTWTYAGNANFIWGTGPTDVWSIGTSYFSNPEIVQVTAVGGSGPGGGYIFGLGNFNLATGVGQTMVYSPSGTAYLPNRTDSVVGVWGSSPTNIFTIGNRGIFRGSGASFTPMSAGTMQNLNGISGTGSTDVFVVGNLGTVRLYDGLGWVPLGSSSLLANLNGVQALPGAVFMVGQNGTITRLLRTSVSCGGTETGAACRDYFDNDCDGLVDACDPDCAGSGPPEQCANGRDDDCDGLVDCQDPDCSTFPFCFHGGACQPAPVITCGGMLSGTNASGINKRSSYPCGSRDEPGPEAYYRFTATSSGMATATLSGFSADLDLLAIGGAPTGACDPDGRCLAATSTANTTQSITFAVSAGQTYFLVVDSANASMSSFTLTLACQ
jgi:hypothetical protein